MRATPDSVHTSVGSSTRLTCGRCSSSLCHPRQELLSKPYDRVRSHPAALKRGCSALSARETLVLVTQRQWRLMVKDSDMHLGRTVQVGGCGSGWCKCVGVEGVWAVCVEVCRFRGQAGSGVNCLP